MLKLKSYAKLNLTLEILGKLNEDYHRILSIMHEIDLYDEIQLKVTKSADIKIKSNIKGLENKDNLVFVSSSLLKKRFNIKSGLVIIIKKNIPIGSGLGGGSSNAAAVLLGLNELWNLSLPNFALMQIAQEIGSDVPFFINGKSALAYNRGEITEQIRLNNHYNFLLITPGIRINTKYAYSLVDTKKTGKTNATKKMLNAIKDGGDIINYLHNDFEEFIFAKHPEIAKIKILLKKYGAKNALMTGSGSTVFGVFSDTKSLNIVYNKFRDNYKSVFCAMSKEL